jgi:hypothetical protein
LLFLIVFTLEGDRLICLIEPTQSIKILSIASVCV